MILIAPTAFKGTLSPAEVATAIAAGIKASSCQESIVSCPLADGGDGTVEAAELCLGGTIETARVHTGDGSTLSAKWLSFRDQNDEPTALVELANACGIALPNAMPLQPLLASTYALGEVMSFCYSRGVRNFVVALGGSASTDGGMGALIALGATFFDHAGQPIPARGGSVLGLVTSCSFENMLLRNCRVRILTDVHHTLLGQNGAAYIFGPQKGASPTQVLQLDQALTHFADVLESHTGRQARDIAGSGAAGGTAFGLICALAAETMSGFDWISQSAQLEPKLDRCSLVITGEGKFDEQSLQGKVIGSLARLCSIRRLPLWVVAGFTDQLPQSQKGIDRLIIPSRVGQHCTALDIEKALGECF